MARALGLADDVTLQPCVGAWCGQRWLERRGGEDAKLDGGWDLGHGFRLSSPVGHPTVGLSRVDPMSHTGGPLETPWSLDLFWQTKRAQKLMWGLHSLQS